MYINVLALCIFICGIVLILFENTGMRASALSGRLKTAGNRVQRRLKLDSGKITAKRRNAAVENEIYQSASLLENIIILQKDTPKGAAYIIEQIASYSKELKKPFENMLYYLRLNQKEEAVKAFAEEAGTKSAEEYGDILIKMDSINPCDLRENVSLLRRRLREESITREKNKNEIMSDLIYIPVLANVMLIFINFIYISYYAEQKDIFQQLLF
ncbi:MAG: hypothetical protein Q4C14_08230 [Bacillota bacterium]|nr:hypothetical protein [Bacillota bacterium]